MLLTRGDAPRSAQRLPLAIIFRAFGAIRIEFRFLGKAVCRSCSTARIQKHVRRMRFGDAARLEVAAVRRAKMVSFLTTSLELRPEDVYAIDGPCFLEHSRIFYF